MQFLSAGPSKAPTLEVLDRNVSKRVSCHLLLTARGKSAEPGIQLALLRYYESDIITIILSLYLEFHLQSLSHYLGCISGFDWLRYMCPKHSVLMKSYGVVTKTHTPQSEMRTTPYSYKWASTLQRTISSPDSRLIPSIVRSKHCSTTI
jgi:hypothetical protein